jgi:reactive intermediate/imine deaminase
MRELSTEEAPASIGPYSQGIRDGDTVYVSGQGPLDPASGEVIDGDIRVQTARTMENVGAVLAAADCSLDDVVKATVFVTDTGDDEAVNAVYAASTSAPYPAHSAVEVADHPAVSDRGRPGRRK